MAKTNLKENKISNYDFEMSTYCHIENFGIMLDEIDKIIKIIEDEHKILSKIYNKYFDFYKRFHYRLIRPKTLIIMQSEINEEINFVDIRLKKMKELKNNKDLKKIVLKDIKDRIIKIIDDYEFVRALFFSLIDDMIIKFIFNNECGPFSHLSVGYRKNNVYNYEQIKKYIEIIKECYKKNKGFYFVCDMCTMELDSGDYIYRIKNEINYKDIKRPKSDRSKEIVDAVYSGKKIKLKNDREKEEYDRLMKQIGKHEEIDEKFNSPSVITGRYPSCILKKKGFDKLVKKDLKKLNKQLYIERKVDECIKYIIINNKCQNKDENKEHELNKLLEVYKTNGEDCFSYEEFLNDSVVARPYMIRWSLFDYKKIILNHVSILFKIDIDLLINKFRETGITVFKKKISEETRNDYSIIRHKNNNYVIKYKDNEIYLGNLFIYRIPALLYTSNDIISYYNLINQEEIELVDYIETNNKS